MKLLIDQDVYALRVRFLRDLGHDLITASEIGMSRAADTELLACAQQAGRIFITRDKDFGGLVFVEGLGRGVILLRMDPSTLQAAHKELKRVFMRYSEAQIAGAFIVVEPHSHRFRKLA